MEAVVDRKEDALECIYERYESLLRTVILNVIRDEADVEDVLHDVMLQLWEQGHTILTKRECADFWSP
jgi:DNA-directed RNA polymerase specialized sigma24 family protein